MQTPHIYLGTGGYSDTDLIGTLYPFGTDKSDFLTIYSQHYDAIEINSTLHSPIGVKALQGMVEKAKERLKVSVKLHQDFSHKYIQIDHYYYGMDSKVVHIFEGVYYVCELYLFDCLPIPHL